MIAFGKQRQRNPECDESGPSCTQRFRPVRVRFSEYGLLDWVRTIESAFIFCVSEDAAEHTFDVLQGGLAQVIFVGDCLEHAAGIHRSELTQLNLTDAIEM